jgi:hypothetical protein
MCFASNPESYRYIPFYSVASGRLREAVSEATTKTSRPEATTQKQKKTVRRHRFKVDQERR